MHAFTTRFLPRFSGFPIAAALLGLAACGAPTTIVQAPLPIAEGVTVVGTGKAFGAPDIAKVNVGVETRAQTVDQASSETRTKTEAMLAAFEKLGIARKDLRTHSYFVQYEQYPQPYPPEPMPMPAPERGASKGSTPAPAMEPARPRGEYRVQNMVEVTVRNVEQVGAVLGAATGAGANVMWGIDFELEDPKPLEAEARQKAVADAKARAAQLAQLSGIELGPVISVMEVSGGGPIMMPARDMMMKAEMAQSGSANIPIEKGEVRVERGVQIVYGPAKK